MSGLGCCGDKMSAADHGARAESPRGGDAPRGGAAAPGGAGRGIAARVFGFFRWLVPVSVLALMPKCPMCLAAYIAVGTGIGLSVSAAWYLRTGLIVVCSACLLYLLVRQAQRVARHRLATER